MCTLGRLGFSKLVIHLSTPRGVDDGSEDPREYKSTSFEDREDRLTPIQELGDTPRRQLPNSPKQGLLGPRI